MARKVISSIIYTKALSDKVLHRLRSTTVKMVVYALREQQLTEERAPSITLFRLLEKRNRIIPVLIIFDVHTIIIISTIIVLQKRK